MGEMKSVCSTEAVQKLRRIGLLLYLFLTPTLLPDASVPAVEPAGDCYFLVAWLAIICGVVYVCVCIYCSFQNLLVIKLFPTGMVDIICGAVLMGGMCVAAF